jgi:hypothetical protein
VGLCPALCDLRRLGLGKLTALDPKPPIVRYERQRPGELIHLNSKKLGRIAGIGHRFKGRAAGTVNRHHGIRWEALHVCIDDATRLAYSEILANERQDSAIGFLERALGWFAGQGVTVERVMTDNGSAYLSKAFRAALTAAGLKHKRTRPYDRCRTGSRVAPPARSKDRQRRGARRVGRVQELPRLPRAVNNDTSSFGVTVVPTTVLPALMASLMAFISRRCLQQEL